MTHKVISLNNAEWRFGSVPQKPFGDVDDLAKVKEWLPAQIPGDVRLDLLRAGRIADPFVAKNNEESQWVDGLDWWYVRDMNLELEPNERAFLIFEGIDYQSAVFMNGMQLGRHTGMFSRQVYEIQAPFTGSQSPGKPQLAIRIWGADALPKMRLSQRQKVWKRVVKPFFSPPNEPFPDRYATLKCQMQFGWDFAPRLRTCGIWDDACVVVTRSVFIEDAWIKAKVAPATRPANCAGCTGGARENQKEKVAGIKFIVALDSDCEQRVRLLCSVRGKNFSCDAQSFAFELELNRGKQQCKLEFDLKDAREWNPWDRGDPHLYEIEAVVEEQALDWNKVGVAHHLLDSVTKTFGIRSFELVREGAQRDPWTFHINGKHEFIRGANWVPLDAIPGRVRHEDYAARLKQARNANINFLRVWGGGLREKRAFYDLCDELGILVWQEFPFAGAMLDRFPRDGAFLNLVDAESGAIVRTLRNHPSLVVWCGGNEFNTRGNRATVEALRGAVEREDGTRPFKPASPSRDESHNWRVWHRLANLRDYKKERTPFLSEFGLQSAPNVESLSRFAPREGLFPPNEIWEYHHAELQKLERYAGVTPPAHENSQTTSASAWWATLPTPSHPPSPKGEGRGLRKGEFAEPLPKPHVRDSSPEPQAAPLEHYVVATQRVQAIALQIAVEHMRRRKSEGTAGVAIWQFNDCWPSISWSVVDYYGVPKQAYHALKRLYSPVLALFDYDLKPRHAGESVSGHLWVINDLRSSFTNAQLTAVLNDKEIFTRRVDIAPDSAERIDSLAVRLGEGENALRLNLNWGPAPLSENEYDLNFCDEGEINPLAAMYVAIGNRLMR